MASIIDISKMRVHLPAADWREAITLSGQVLEEIGSITHEYTENMIRAVEEMGPYMVIMPGFAIAHAAPCAAVLKEDLALVTLAEPVCFGSPNDPVTTILCVACIDRDSPMRALQTVAEALCGEGVMENLAKAQTVEELHAVLHGG